MRLKNAKNVTEAMLKAYAEDKEVLHNTAQALLLNALSDLNGKDPIAHHHAKKFLNNEQSEFSLSKCCKILNINESFIKNKISYLSKLAK